MRRRLALAAAVALQPAALVVRGELQQITLPCDSFQNNPGGSALSTTLIERPQVKVQTAL